MDGYTHIKHCCICNKPIEPEPSGWAQGNNAEPVKPGRCCNLCNGLYVIPARLRAMADGQHGKAKGS